MKTPKSRLGRPNPKRVPLPVVPEHTSQPAKPVVEEPELDETIRKMLEAAYT